MGFEPHSGDHAIVEIVFGLKFTQPLNPAVAETLIAAREHWAPELPRVSRGGGFQFAFSGAEFEVPAPFMGGAVMLDRVKPDGSLDWRVRVDDDSVYVNCLSYSRWKDISPRAIEYLRTVCAAVQADIAISAVVLQCIDAFDWVGDLSGYEASELINFESDLVPLSLRGRGPLWHLHQGWYRDEPELGEGRLLERMHLDAGPGPDALTQVRLDSYLEFKPALPPSIDAGWGAAKATIPPLFDTLHELNKIMIRSVLTEGAAKRVGLNA